MSRTRLTASVTERLDRIATELEQSGRPDMALAVDKVSDRLDKMEEEWKKTVAKPPKLLSKPKYPVSNPKEIVKGLYKNNHDSFAYFRTPDDANKVNLDEGMGFYPVKNGKVREHNGIFYSWSPIDSSWEVIYT